MFDQIAAAAVARQPGFAQWKDQEAARDHALGDALAAYTQWNVKRVLRICGAALQDANEKEASQVIFALLAEMGEGLDFEICPKLREAIRATFAEHYGG